MAVARKIEREILRNEYLQKVIDAFLELDDEAAVSVLRDTDYGVIILERGNQGLQLGKLCTEVVDGGAKFAVIVAPDSQAAGDKKNGKESEDSSEALFSHSYGLLGHIVI